MPRFVAGRLRVRAAEPLFDVLELFAFVRPGQPFVPSALGLARAWDWNCRTRRKNSRGALHAIARAPAAGSAQTGRGGARRACAAGRTLDARGLALGDRC